MTIRCTSVALGLWLPMAAPAPAGPPGFEFVEAGPASGILPYTMAEGMGGGLAAADFDDDGHVDLFVPNDFGVPDQLYRNRGDGTFEEVASTLGVASLDRSRTALWLDADGDRRLDLLVARDGWHAQVVPTITLKLYRQQPGGAFTDATAAAELDLDLLDGDATHIGGLCAGDLDNDGDLELCLTGWDGSTYLFLNDGDGTFTDISVSSGLAAGHSTAWQPIMHDFDGDGFLDIFVAVDFSENHLWLNQRNNTFVDVAAAAGVANAFNEMGVALGDHDADGDLDLYITNVTRDGRHNLLYRNDTVAGTLAFVDVAPALGIEDTHWGWGVTFLDGDGDGHVDLAATNGFWDPGFTNDPSKFFLNGATAPPSFSDVSAAVGFDDTEFGSALVAADLDRDGDLDMVQTCNLGGPLRLLENRRVPPGPGPGYLVVRPRRPDANHRAIGAVVRATVGSLTMTRLITAGTSFMGQEPAEAFFGLGSATVVDRVVVEWPGAGGFTEVTDVAANRVVTLGPCRGDVNVDDTVDVLDLLALLAAWGRPGDGEDVNLDGVVNVLDLLALLGVWGACA